MKKTTLTLLLSVLGHNAMAAPEDRVKDCSNNSGSDCAIEAVSKNVDKEVSAVRADPISVFYNSVKMDLWQCELKGDKYYTPGTNELCSRVQPVILSVPENADQPNGQKVSKAFVEAAGIFNALNYELSWDGAQQRIVANRDINGQKDTFIMYLGSRNVYVYKNDNLVKSFKATAAPFVATSGTYNYDRTMVPLTLIGKASGASVDWDITSCKESGISGCVTGQDSFGNYRATLDAYQRGQDYYGFTPSTKPDNWLEVVQWFKANPETYDVPFENHDMSGLGMYPANGGLASGEDYQLSEPDYLPFVMSARRQTDQAVRVLYELLPQQARDNVLYIMPDRVAKNPKKYADYLRMMINRPGNDNLKLYVLGSFMGTRRIDSVNHMYYQPTMLRHARELFKLKNTLLLVSQMGFKKDNINIIYSMGDSLTDFAQTVKNNLQKRVDKIADAAGVSRFKISMGADEVAHLAFANALPEQKVYVGLYHNFNVKHPYDGDKLTKTIIAEKFAEMNLVPVYDENQRLDADFEVYIYNRHPDTFSKIDNACEFDIPDCNAKAAEARALQDKTDTGDVAGSPHFGKTFREYIGGQIDSSLAQRPTWSRDKTQGRMVVLDMRAPNGAWNIKSLPYSAAKLLQYSGWGTMANSLGMAVSSAKILTHKAKGSELDQAIAVANARRMTIEAIVQDNFVIGYQFGQRPGTSTLPSLRDRLTNNGIVYSNYQSYQTEAQLKKAFGIVNSHANNLMQTYKNLLNSPVDYTVHITPQFWRHFEQEVHLTPVKQHEIFASGVLRSKFKGTALDPDFGIRFENGSVKSELTLTNLGHQ